MERRSTRAELLELIRRVKRHARIGAVGFSAYDPAADPEGRIARIAIEAAVAVAGRDD